MEISEVILKNKDARPTSLQFQNGRLLDQRTDLSCGLYTNDAHSVIPVLASDTLIYTGQTVEQNAYNTFIAVRNKRTNKLKLIQINEALLKPQPPKMREIMDSTMMEKNKHALTELNKEFGSKKTKRQTETLERLKVNVDNFKDQLEKTVANISLDDMTIQEETRTSDILPHINKEASYASEVYTLASLLPAGVLKSLEQPAEALLSMTEDEIVTDEFVKKQILELQDSSDGNAQEKVVILLAVDAILTVFNTTARKIGTRGFEASKYSKALNEYVLDNFTVKTGKTRTRPMALKDKAACYIIVLSLLLNKDGVNVEELSMHLKLSARKITDFCTVLLLHVKDKRAVVKLPLPAPRVFLGNGKKGRK